ncbi:hypothetical protein QN277_011623 [Acacia crassicarpa]|uniref:ABC transporter domain-containing protein n=1 Tax=Acacia crassicarpa TaxID=499986 RepID=A0AAE1MZD4_9FABA|nr:hypothetical protein QN277_011623 [Acacia crassicarpa]
MDIGEPSCIIVADLPTLRELFRLEDEAQREATSDDSITTEYHTPDGNGSGIEPSRSSSFVLTFNNLTYSVKVRHKLNFSTLFSAENRFGEPETKILLNDISGEARDGEILAVMGASGSGKSTLIDALANRIAKGNLKGSVKLNGEALESRLLKAISAYVMQDDLLFPMLTVEETLMFAAEFRLSHRLSRSKKKMRVQALIDQLDLRNAAKTVIGNEGHRGVSGGERRRVSIGIDIIHDPIILFLDEPTSGLDSTSAFTVVKVLQTIAHSGSIVVMAIHQPSSRILGLIDRMMFLSRGEIVFSGSPLQLPLFFDEFDHPIPEDENQTEFALDLIHELEGSSSGIHRLVEFNKSWQIKKQPGSNDSTEVEYRHHGLSLKEAVSTSILRGKLVSGIIKPTDSSAARSSSSSTSSKVPTFANPLLIEVTKLSIRSYTNSRRTPAIFRTRLAIVLITGSLLASVFWRLDHSPKGVQERLSFFAFAMSSTFYTTAEALPMFLQDRYIFMRETAYNTYRRSSYVFSHALVSLPSLLVLSLAFAATTFWAVGLDGGWFGFLFYFIFIFASFWAGNSFVTFLSGVLPHEMLGYTIVVKTLAYFLLFSGFFINRDRIPVYWIWFHYLSLVKYPYEAVMQNEFDDPVSCFVKGVQVFDNTPLGELPSSMKLKLLQSLSGTLGTNITSSTCLTRGTDILQQNGITQLSKWNCLWVTVSWGFLFRALFYFSLLLGSKNKRR